MAKQAVQQMTTLLNELDELLVGWNVDHSSKTMYLDVEVTAQAGTHLAEQLAQIKVGKTQFAGFSSPNAAVQGHWLGVLSDADVAQAKLALAELRKQAVEELDNQNLPENQAEKATQLLNDVAEILEKTVESRKISGGVLLNLDPSAVTFVVGSTIVDGDKLNDLVKQLVEEIQKNDPEASKMIKLDAENYEGVRLHAFNIPAPDESAVPFFGDTLEVVMGISNDKLLVAVGRDAAKTLKDVLSQSKANLDKEMLPVQISISIGQIVKFAASVAEEDDAKAQAAMLANALEKSEGKDHVTFTTKPITNGVRARLEVEEGLLKLIGSMGQMVTPGSQAETSDSGQ